LGRREEEEAVGLAPPDAGNGFIKGEMGASAMVPLPESEAIAEGEGEMVGGEGGGCVAPSSRGVLVTSELCPVSLASSLDELSVVAAQIAWDARNAFVPLAWSGINKDMVA
jgi:hypothetical protein